MKLRSLPYQGGFPAAAFRLWRFVVASAMALIALSVSARCYPPQDGTAGKEPSKWTGRIKLEVSGDESLIPLVSSYIGRELRALGDVVVTDSSPNAGMEVIALKEESPDGAVNFGYTLSVVTTFPLNDSIIRTILKDKVEQSLIEEVGSFYSDGNIVTAFWVVTGPPSGLEDLCKRIVAQFDTQNLQHQRELQQKFNDRKKQQKQRK